MARKSSNESDDRSESKKGKPSKSSGGSNVLLIGGLAAILFLCCTCGGVGTGGFVFRDRLGFGGTQVAQTKDRPPANDDNKAIDKAKPDDKTPTDQPLDQKPIDEKPIDKKPKGKKASDKKATDKKPPPAGDLGTWKEVRAEKGKFSIDLPVRSIDDKSPVGGLGDLFVQVAGSTKGHTIGVASTQRRGGGASTPAKDVAQNNAQTPDFPDKKDITLQGHPGVERRSPDGKTLVRCYVSAERIYVITVLCQSGKFDRAIADRAFNSFKILD